MSNQSSHRRSSCDLPLFPAIRDCGLSAASRDQFKKQVSLMKIQYNYEKYSRIAGDIAMRRQIIREVLQEQNECELDITYYEIMTLPVVQLKQLIEQKKQAK